MFKIISICKGGGYRYCRTEPPHPKRNAKGLYPLHRVLVENKINRLLEDEEEVHHVDEDKTNDTIDNLEIKTKAEHARHHKPGNPPVGLICPCGKEFWVKKNEIKLRQRGRKDPLCCSRSCGRKYAKPRCTNKTVVTA